MTDNLSLHITTLLRRNDCVVVPGVGAFVATRREATLANGVLTAPAREISFNPALTYDDGLLASSVSRRLKISFEQARERVAAESALLQRRLRNEGAVQLSHVGLLQRRSGGRLEFVPERAWTLAAPSLHIAPSAPAFEVVRNVATEPERAVAVVRVPLRLRWLRVAAVACVLSLIGFALSTPIDITTAQHASLAAPTFTAPEPEVIEPLAIPAGLELNLAYAAEPGMVITEPEVDQPYVVVVASLPTAQKASEFIAESGLGLQYIQSDGRYRVYAAQGDTPESARAAADKISGFAARFPDSWVCHR